MSPSGGAGQLKGGAEGEKILHEVSDTGACLCSIKREAWPAHLVRLPRQSAAAVAQLVEANGY